MSEEKERQTIQEDGRSATGSGPLVSVIMPAYQAERFIEASIASVLSQTYSRLELWVIDDASTDRTGELVQAMAAQDARVHYVRNETNQGTARSRNRAILLSQGEYLALLDSDDLWHPDKLSRQLALCESTGAQLVCSSHAIINEKGEKCCPDFIAPARITLKSMLVSNQIGCLTVLLERAALGEDRFLPDFYHEDYVLWLQLLQKGILAVGQAEVLAEYRMLSGSRSFRKTRALRHRWVVYTRYLRLPLWKALYYLLRYAAAGIRKYRRGIKQDGTI